MELNMKATGYTHSIKKANEDVYGVTDHGAFVLDGASALTANRFTSAENDVVWMVKWWYQYLLAHLDNTSQPLLCLLEEGVKAFNSAFSGYKSIEELSKLEQVSAGIAVVRLFEGVLECFVLGDVEISLKHLDGTLEILTDEKIKLLDNQVIELMNQHQDREQACVFKDFTEEEWELLKRNRMTMNTAEGYAILSHDVGAISRGIYRRTPFNKIESCLLSTDGLAVLDGYYNRSRLMEEIKIRGIKDLIAELRTYEAEDNRKIRLRRLKTHDDATAVFLEF